MHFRTKRSVWSEETTCNQLIVALEGEAIQFVDTLPLEIKDDLESLQKALKKRFGCSASSTIYRFQLQSLRRDGRSLASLGQEIRRLMKLAYPGLTGELKEDIAIDQFCASLDEPQLHLAVYQARAHTLDEALDVAIHMEEYKLMEARNFKAETTSPRKEETSDMDTRDMFTALMREVKKGQEQLWLKRSRIQ